MRIFPVVTKRVTVVQGGDGPNPSDSFSLNIRTDDTNAAPSDAMSVGFTFPDTNAALADALALNLSFPDTNDVLTDLLTQLRIAIADTIPLPTDALSLGITFPDTNAALADAITLAMSFPDTNSALADALTQLRIVMSDSNSAPTDAATFLLNYLLAESNTAATDALTTLRIAGYNDTNTAPADALTTLRIAGLGDTNTAPADALTKLAPTFFEANSPNLLTANQSSVETDTTGWVAQLNCTIARDTTLASHGSASLRVRATAANANTQACTTRGTGGVPAVAGELVSVSFDVRAATTPRPVTPFIEYFDSAGTAIGNTMGSVIDDSTSGWREATVSGTCPTNTAFVCATVNFGAAIAAGEDHYLDRIRLKRGRTYEWELGAGPSAVPVSDGRSATATWTQGATTAAQTGNWVNPTNAQGLRNATDATLTDGALDSNQGTLTLDPYPDPDSSFSTWTISQVRFRFFGSGTNFSATPPSLHLEWSTNGTAWNLLETITANFNNSAAGNPRLLTPTAPGGGWTWTLLNNMRFRARYVTGIVAVTGTVNVDACELEITATKNPL